jgi:hypothetical protein
MNEAGVQKKKGIGGFDKCFWHSDKATIFRSDCFKYPNIDFFFREFFIFTNLQRINCFGVYIAQQTLSHFKNTCVAAYINFG